MRTLFDSSRPIGRLSYFLISLLVAFLATRLEAQGPQLTPIVDTLYRPDGTPAQGTILVKWKAFTTSDGKAVPAGTLSVPIGAGGAVSLALAPNVGATPSGSYYAVTYQLSDGVHSEEIWAVPAAGPVTVGAIRSQVVPAGVAMQVASRQYVDDQLALKATDANVVHKTGNESIAGVKTFTSSPSVPTPTAPGEAANKAYVDASGGGGGAPGGTDTQLQFNDTGAFGGDARLTFNKTTGNLAAKSVNGARYADQFANIQAAITDAGTGGTVVIPRSYSGSDTYTNPNNIPITDLRGAPDRQRGIINVVSDCGLPTDGVTDATAAMRACRAANPGKHFLFPKLRAYNSSACDYTFSDSALTSSETNITSEHWEGGGGTSGMVENNPSTVRLCFASGVTGLEVAKSTGNGFSLSNLRLVGGDCYSWTNGSTYIMPLGWGGTAANDGIRAHSRVKLRNLSVECFGRHGINLDTDGYQGNTNTSVLDTVQVSRNRGAGLFIRGVDSNAMRLVSVTATANQLDGIVDRSFLGNTHIAHHTDGNGWDVTAEGAPVSLTSYSITNNYATVTAASHGLARGDWVRISSTYLTSRYFVLDVPSANTFVVYAPQVDRAPVTEAGSIWKHTPASTNWSKALSGCSITSGTSLLTCNSGGLIPYGVIGYPVTILGAGAGGTNLVTFVTEGLSTACAVSTWQIAANALTVNCPNSFSVGQVVTLVAFDNDDLRDREVTVATQSAGQFTASFTHADVALHSDTSALVFAPTVGVKDDAGTTVSGANGTIFYRHVPYRILGDAQSSLLLGLYSESDQVPAIIGHKSVVIEGAHGAGIDHYITYGSKYMRSTANGLEFTVPGATIWGAGTKRQNLEQKFQPGPGFTSRLNFFSFNAATSAYDEKFRINAGTTFILDDMANSGRDVLNVNPESSLLSFYCTTAGAICTTRQGSDTSNANWEWRSANTVVGSIIGSTGLIKFTAFSSNAADPADAGAVRLGNAECVAWEASPAGTDKTLCLDSGNVFQLNGAVTLAGALSGATTGAFSGQITSTLATGTAPLVITSTTPVANLTLSVDSQLPTIASAGKVSDSALSANVSLLGQTVGGSELANPAVGAKGGVEAKTCSGTDKLSAIGTDGVPVCSADQTSAGGGITTLNTLTQATQTFSKQDDTNVTLAITSATANHEFALGWTGTLAKARGGTGQDNSSLTFPSSGTIPVTVASGTAALGTSAIASGACASVVTMSASGVVTTDVIQWTPNADISAVIGYTPDGNLRIYPYPTANNVNFKVCNGGTSSVTPGAVTLNWRVTR